MLWKDKIDLWLKGEILEYPINIKTRFFYQTSVCDKKLKNKYNEFFLLNNNLDYLIQDYTVFIEYIKKSKNKYATSFYNISRDALLVIPIPRKNKIFTTVKDFIDNSSIKQQKILWKLVAKNVLKLLETYDQVYVSTHGLGVSYLHVRIDLTPKYYN